MSRSSFLLTCAFGTTLSGCATVPSRPLEARIIAESSRSLDLIHVRAEQRGDHVAVSGLVARRTMTRGSVRGHLHIEALIGTTVIAWADTQWSQLAKHRVLTSSFRADLPFAASQASEFRVSHMLAKHDAPKRRGNVND